MPRGHNEGWNCIPQSGVVEGQPARLSFVTLAHTDCQTLVTGTHLAALELKIRVNTIKRILQGILAHFYGELHATNLAVMFCFTNAETLHVAKVANQAVKWQCIRGVLIDN